MGLELFADTELRKAGLFDASSDYAGMLGDSVMSLVKAFAGQGHSGHSAEMAIELFSRVASYRTLSPCSHEKTKDPMGDGSSKQCEHCGAIWNSGGALVYDRNAPETCKEVG